MSTTPEHNDSNDFVMTEEEMLELKAFITDLKQQRDKFQADAHLAFSLYCRSVAASHAMLAAWAAGESKPWEHITREIPAPPQDLPIAALWDVTFPRDYSGGTQ